MSEQAKDVRLEGVSKRFGAVTAVHPQNLSVPAGEFLTLLGPSGCGKTTLLRMIAGLEGVTGGRIFVGGDDVTQTPPNRRDTSIMFQDYALFPHKTLVDNIAYGLKMQGMPKTERNRRASEWLKRIGLPDFADRYPHELSGGQRQRVALARSLIISPGVLLLDEPLGALDANLRRQLQGELKRIHSEVGLTFIYVTHDQEEALTMSDRIAVMKDGRVEQIASPSELYDRPQTEFVARFMGVPNIISAKVSKTTGKSVEAACEGFATLRFKVADVAVGDEVKLAIRPNNIALKQGRMVSSNAAPVTIVDTSFAGDVIRATARNDAGAMLIIEIDRQHCGELQLEEGSNYLAHWNEQGLIPLKATPS